MKSKSKHLRIVENFESVAKSEATIRCKTNRIEIHTEVTSHYFSRFQHEENRDKLQRPIRRNSKLKSSIFRKILAAFIKKAE